MPTALFAHITPTVRPSRPCLADATRRGRTIVLMGDYVGLWRRPRMGDPQGHRPRRRRRCAVRGTTTPPFSTPPSISMQAAAAMRWTRNQLRPQRARFSRRPAPHASHRRHSLWSTPTPASPVSGTIFQTLPKPGAACAEPMRAIVFSAHIHRLPVIPSRPPAR